jgi:hypothetical protein
MRAYIRNAAIAGTDLGHKAMRLAFTGTGKVPRRV